MELVGRLEDSMGRVGRLEDSMGPVGRLECSMVVGDIQAGRVGGVGRVVEGRQVGKLAHMVAENTCQMSHMAHSSSHSLWAADITL